VRIRTIKPEWLEDERILLASAEARVLSISLILLSDDYGNGRAFTLGSRVFPTSPHLAEPALRELVERRFVELYEVDGQRYFHIRNWEKHQKVDKPGKPHVPAPDAARPKRVSEKKVAYFIRGATTGLIKIGESVDPVRRLAELAKGGSERLELLAVGGTERQLHAELAGDRVHGEWFRATRAVLAKVIENGGDPERPITSCGYDENHKIDLREHSREPIDDGDKDSGIHAPDLRTEGPKDPDREGSACAVAPPPASSARVDPEPPAPPPGSIGAILRAAPPLEPDGPCQLPEFTEATIRAVRKQVHDLYTAKVGYCHDLNGQHIQRLTQMLRGVAQARGEALPVVVERAVLGFLADPYWQGKRWPLNGLVRQAAQYADPAKPGDIKVVDSGKNDAKLASLRSKVSAAETERKLAASMNPGALPKLDERINGMRREMKRLEGAA